MGALLVTAPMALVLLAGLTLVATAATLARSGAMGRRRLLLPGGGDLALPLLALAAHGAAAPIIRLRARR